jgi:hypothetical protein
MRFETIGTHVPPARLSRASSLVYGRSRRPCPPPTLLLAKALQHLKVQPDLPVQPHLGLAQFSERLRREPSLYTEDPRPS